ncbi:hypothetical protein BH24GEM3_BH24GEM3_12240 [soil metagenome]
MKIKRTVLGPTLVAAVAVLSGGWLLQRGVVQQGEGVGNSRLFDEVVQYISTRYVDEHPSAELYQKAVDGLLRELGDPHTSFLTAEQYRNMRIQMGGDYGGLGIEIGVRDGWITIISPLPNSPGEAAGLLPGDRIIEVEGESTRGWTSDDAVKVLRGPRGTPVNIRVARIGVDEPIAFRVVREEIHTTSVLYSYLTDGGVGVVRLRTFGENAVEELNQSIEALRRQGMQRLVLDLRENPGGILDQGIAISDMFLKRGDVIAETRYRDPRQNERYRASQGERFPDLPAVVLVDEYSASASEIVAGALQDNDRALVLGAPSFGKGSVQTLYPLSGGNYLKMTTGRWYTPAGRSIEKARSRNGDPVALLDEEATATPEGMPVPSGEVEEDTVPRQPYRTAGGRTVYGGGGIVPDLTVRPDTAITTEQTFFRTVAKGGSKYYDVLARYAIEYGRQNQGLRPDFQVTAAMRDELFRRLQAAELEIERGDFDAARRLVDQHLVNQIAVNKFGRHVAAMRQLAADNALRTAVEMLRSAPNQQALFQMARTRAQASRS